MKDQIIWAEIYRPKTVEECILPEAIKSVFQEFVNKKEIPNLLLSGTTGLGKTSVAKAMCEEIGCDYIVINGSNESGIDILRTKITGYASSMSLMGGRKVIIIDEADGMTATMQDGLRGTIEMFANNCSFIFTCNRKHKIIEAIHSRCANIEFKINGSKQKLATQLMKRIEFILKEQGVEYQREVVAAFIAKYFPDNRRILNEIQFYSATGKIDSGILANIGDVQINELVKNIKAKAFTACRKWVAANMDNDASKIFRKLYDGLHDFLEPASIPEAVLILGKYQFQSGFVSDQEINLMACITEMMVQLEFV